VNSIAAFTERVPVVTKQMLRDDQAEQLPFGSYLGARPVDVCRVHGSSGTSGGALGLGAHHAEFTTSAREQNRSGIGCALSKN
jgi:phenylacetate-CoA ligase